MPGSDVTPPGEPAAASVPEPAVAAAPAPSAPALRRSAWSPLAHRVFLILFIAQFVSNVGTRTRPRP